MKVTYNHDLNIYDISLFKLWNFPIFDGIHFTGAFVVFVNNRESVVEEDTRGIFIEKHLNQGNLSSLITHLWEK